MATTVTSSTITTWATQSSASTMTVGCPASVTLKRSHEGNRCRADRRDHATRRRTSRAGPGEHRLRPGGRPGRARRAARAGRSGRAGRAARVGSTSRRPTDAAALRAARELRAALDALLRAAAGRCARAAGRRGPVERSCARRVRRGPAGPGARRAGLDLAGRRPVDRRCTASRVAAVELLTDPAELARLRCCAGCCWLYLDHSRGAGRRWCSMADCGTERQEAPLRAATPGATRRTGVTGREHRPLRRTP